MRAQGVPLADGGATWVRDHFEPVEELDAETSPYPELVSLGVDETGADVLVDLEAAGGVVAIDRAQEAEGILVQELEVTALAVTDKRALEAAEKAASEGAASPAVDQAG